MSAGSSTTPDVDAALRRAESYERHFVPVIGEPVARRLVATADARPGDRVLDVACGTGVAARLVAQVVGPDAVAGLDPDPAMLGVAAAVGPAGITWHTAPAERMPLPDEAFDLALCSMGMQFFGDRARAMAELCRVLAPGGRVAWCTPGPTPPMMEEIEQALVRHAGAASARFVQAVFALHDPDAAHELMRTAGFDVVEATVASIPLRLPPPAQFLWQYVESTPLVGVMADLGERERRALEVEVVERCVPFVTDDGGSRADVDLLTVTGRRH